MSPFVRKGDIIISLGFLCKERNKSLPVWHFWFVLKWCFQNAFQHILCLFSTKEATNFHMRDKFAREKKRTRNIYYVIAFINSEIIMSPFRTKGDILFQSDFFFFGRFRFFFRFFSAKLVRTITFLSFQIGQWYLVCGCITIRRRVTYRCRIGFRLLDFLILLYWDVQLDVLEVVNYVIPVPYLFIMLSILDLSLRVL
jgi:hypothetical protein